MSKPSLQSIQALVSTDLAATDLFISEQLQSRVPLINQVVKYILECGGKRIRPLLVLLCTKMFDKSDQKSISLAAIIEFIHTATLLHDDVVDKSTLRRGHKTANVIWGNQASVLVGDFLYSRAFQLMQQMDDSRVIAGFAHSTNLIAEGEVMQMVNTRNPEITEESYFEVIRRKTAMLFEVACELSAAICNRTDSEIQAMRTYGENLGISYQLIDDALDYNASSEVIGKNIGDDLSEGKPTLPLIYAMRHGTSKQAALIKDAIKKASVDCLDEIVETIQATNALIYTAKQAEKYANKAIQPLDIMPNSSFKEALSQLCQFAVERVS